MLLAFVTSCSKVYTGQPNIGNNPAHTRGVPQFSYFSTSDVLENNDTQAIIFVDIVDNSLIFKNYSDTLLSKVSLEHKIVNNEDSNVIDKKYNIIIGKSKNHKYYDYSSSYKEYAYKIAPGDYSLRITLTDLHTNLRTTKEIELKIPHPKQSSFFLSDIRFFEKRESNTNYKSINGYNVNSDFDSLKFNYQITSNTKDNDFSIQSTLYTYNYDDAPAKPMSDRNFRASSIEYRGIDYVNEEIVERSSRKLYIDESITIEKNFTNLEKGNYRYEALIENSEGEKYFKIRDFSIKSKNYPYLNTASELARPLYYLMKNEEYQKINTFKSADSVKKAIDLFWLQEIKNSVTAKKVIELYYQRVEESNLQFSSFKEGWKTDLGMIYILFGPPMYVDQGFGKMTWYYEFDAGLVDPKIVFQDTRHMNTKFPFKNYILVRSSDLFNLQYTQIQSWRDGSILKSVQ